MTWKRYFVLAFALLPASGCSPTSLAKRGYTELKGASGKVVPVREASAGFYGSVGELRIGTVVNTIMPVCPTGVHACIMSALREHAASATEKLSGNKVCTADVEIIYYQPPGGVMALIGKGAILLGRARLLDENRQMQADLLIGVFSRAMRTTDNEMADTFGDTLSGHVVEEGD